MWLDEAPTIHFSFSGITSTYCYTFRNTCHFEASNFVSIWSYWISMNHFLPICSLIYQVSHIFSLNCSWKSWFQSYGDKWGSHVQQNLFCCRRRVLGERWRDRAGQVVPPVLLHQQEYQIIRKYPPPAPKIYRGTLGEASSRAPSRISRQGTKGN